MITLFKTKYRVQNHLLNWLILFFAASLFVGCNNKADQNASTVDSTDTTDPGAKQALTAVDPRLDVLYTDSTTFANFYANTGNDKKWVLKHSISDSSDGDFTLAVWPETARRYESGSLILSNGTDSKIDIGDKTVLFGDQRLKKKEVKLLRDSLTANPGKKYIIFEPLMKTVTSGTVNYNVIYYNISISDAPPTSEGYKTTAALVSVTDSNPSPPADALD
jgi:uncharacterized lipoprotein NlpE involved in copper resistance